MSTVAGIRANAVRTAELPGRLVLAVAGGVLLNPLNSSMIAVALRDLGRAFAIDIGTATWLVSAFYVGGAIGMPLMGRLADVFGPRRVFCLSLLLVGVSSLAAPFAPGFGWLLVLRVLLAFGTSGGYPAGLAIFRRYTRDQRAPASALGVISVASSVSSALGPVIGGGLVAILGWPAIFLVNLPLALVVLVLGIVWLPASNLRNKVPTRDLALNRRLVAVYAQFGAVNVVFYSVFFGVPLWLEAARGTPDQSRRSSACAEPNVPLRGCDRGNCRHRLRVWPERRIGRVARPGGADGRCEPRTGRGEHRTSATAYLRRTDVLLWH